MTSRLPTHLVEHIETTTGLPIGLASGRAKPGRCPHCGAPVLAGYDHHRIAHLAITNPHALTPQLEAAALALHIPTWQLHGTPGHHTLTRRTYPGVPLTLPLPPADKVTVLAEHQCHKTLGGTPITIHPSRNNEWPTQQPGDPF